MPKKIRTHQLAQWNFILAAGEEEEKTGTVDIRTRENERMGKQIRDCLICVSDLSYGLLNRLKIMPQSLGTLVTTERSILRSCSFDMFGCVRWLMRSYTPPPYTPS